MNPRRLITLLYVALLGGFGVAAALLLIEARGEYRQLKETERVTRVRLAEKEAQLVEQKRILERLRTDPVYVEKVLRDRLHYANPGEVVFRFDD